MNKKILSTALLASLCIGAFAQTPPERPASGPAPAARGPAYEVALELARVAVQNCAARNQRIAISVLDSAGVVRVLLASDGASARGVQSSTGKALTALHFKANSGAIGEQAKTDKALADQVAANSAFNARAGGVPIRVGDELIGAVGVGGARGSDVDEACAVAGLQAVQSRLQ